MSHKDIESKSFRNESKLEFVRKESNNFIVKHNLTGNISSIEDTFAEMFPMWVGRILITADNLKWALTAANVATGFATSVIASPAEAGLEGIVDSQKTPDGRPGVLIQIYHSSRNELKKQIILRIGQCILTCPTTAAFNALESVRLIRIGSNLRYFGDGFEKKDKIFEKTVWKIPVMEGEFLMENRFGIKKGAAGGNFLILSKNKDSGLKAAEKSIEAISKLGKVITPFPGGICRAGSKIGSNKYKLVASTNHYYCPILKNIVKDTKIEENINNVYEIVIDGLTPKSVEKAMKEGIQAALEIEGVIKITAANYGGKLGPYKVYLKDLIL